MWWGMKPCGEGGETKEVSAWALYHLRDVIHDPGCAMKFASSSEVCILSMRFCKQTILNPSQ